MGCLWSVGISSQSCVPSQLLVHPSPLADGVEREAERALTRCKPCSVIFKTFSCFQCYFEKKSKAQLHPSYREGNKLCPRKTSALPSKHESKITEILTFFLHLAKNIALSEMALQVYPCHQSTDS